NPYGFAWNRRGNEDNVDLSRNVCGGAAPSWSHKKLQAILAEDLARGERVVALDFHTRPGRTRPAEISIPTPPASGAYQSARAIWGDKVVSSVTGESVPPPQTGTLSHALAQWLPKTALTFAVLKIATLPPETISEVLRQDQATNNSSNNQKLTEE